MSPDSLSFSFWKEKKQTKKTKQLEAAFLSIQDLVEEEGFKELCEDERTFGMLRQMAFYYMILFWNGLWDDRWLCIKLVF